MDEEKVENRKQAEGKTKGDGDEEECEGNCDECDCCSS